MSLKHAILVLLENEPGSGYDLAQRFRSGIGHFWNASHQQVYQELKKLHRARLVKFEVEAQHERPDRKVYRITPAGHRALEAWFRTGVKPPRVKDELLIKVFGGHLTDRDVLLSELDDHLGRYRTRLDEYRELEQGYFSQDERVRERYRLPYLTLRRGIRYILGMIDWLEEAKSLIESGRLPAKPLLPAGSRTKPARR
jgi:PadR family transcriptional regulator AphA